MRYDLFEIGHQLPKLAAFVRAHEQEWAAFIEPTRANWHRDPFEAFAAEVAPDIESILHIAEEVIAFCAVHSEQLKTFSEDYDLRDEWKTNVFIRERNAWRRRRGLKPQYMEANDL